LHAWERGKRGIRGVPKKMNVARIGGEGHVQLEDHGLILFVSPCHNLLCEPDDRFKVRVMLILRLRQLSTVRFITDAG
jgi:hypothetical protein